MIDFSRYQSVIATPRWRLFLIGIFVKPIDKLSIVCYNYYTVHLYLVQFGGIYE